MPLNILALFISVQVDIVCWRTLAFEQMLSAAIQYQRESAFN